MPATDFIQPPTQACKSSPKCTAPVQTFAACFAPSPPLAPDLRTPGLKWKSGCLLSFVMVVTGSSSTRMRSLMGRHPLFSERSYQPSVLRYPIVPSGLMYSLHVG